MYMGIPIYWKQMSIWFTKLLQNCLHFFVPWISYWIPGYISIWFFKCKHGKELKKGEWKFTGDGMAIQTSHFAWGHSVSNNFCLAKTCYVMEDLITCVHCCFWIRRQALFSVPYMSKKATCTHTRIFNFSEKGHNSLYVSNKMWCSNKVLIDAADVTSSQPTAHLEELLSKPSQSLYNRHMYLTSEFFH